MLVEHCDSDCVSGPETLKLLPLAFPKILKMYNFDNQDAYSGNSTGLK